MSVEAHPPGLDVLAGQNDVAGYTPNLENYQQLATTPTDQDFQTSRMPSPRHDFRGTKYFDPDIDAKEKEMIPYEVNIERLLDSGDTDSESMRENQAMLEKAKDELADLVIKKNESLKKEKK
ncbi:uncharacterized protein KY384_005649 [Bacidia gigantensis]|uniref:uncharacterized protein n=1 Tax=Bacidia gigantensis TaxID=2732470 RepID=UPI001D052AB0|nr:uncharacterized protein KY384_005649 [Bacidia gigantensis]KAG8530166.1 hypothetical protein KY384_005649 [Bacidia gigantensis]